MREEITDNPFTVYAELLEDIDATADEAASRMWENYENAITNYTVESIMQIFSLNLTANQKKYDDLVKLYEWDFHPFADKFYDEDYRHLRTPNLVSTSEATGSGTADSARNQTRTTTNTPSTTTTTTHSVQPYDNSGMRQEYIDATTDGGSGTTTEAYSGNPDHSETTSSAESTVTQKGSDLNEYNRKYIGRSGNRPTSEVIADGVKAAAMHDILDAIISDLAQQIFIQAWII